MFPIILAFLKKVKLNKAPKWFGEADSFEEQKDRLVAHELRIEGTLLFWKNKATAHYYLHIARVSWSLMSAVTLPVIIQFYDKTDSWSVAFLTAFTVFSGFIVALAYAMKSEDMSRGLRECESDYYDVARALLDDPGSTPDERKKQVDNFFETAKRIRQAGRKVETNRPPSGVSNP
ncbi:MAG: hypothetical protein QM487_03395 [Candidatus Marithrix sp.]